MWHHNKKNPMVSTPPKPPAAPAPLNASAKTNTAIKFTSPEIRVGLNATSKTAKTHMFKAPKMPKAKSMPRRPLAK